MLDHISWTSYLLSILAAVLVYYSWFLLRFYRKRLIGFSGHKSESSGKQTFIPSITPVMGPIAEESESVTGSDEILFGDTAPDDQTPDHNEHRTDPERARFLKEVEALIKVVAESAEPKTHFLLLAGLLAEKYASIAKEEDRDLVTQRLLDPANGFAFELRPEDLNELWREPVNI